MTNFSDPYLFLLIIPVGLLIFWRFRYWKREARLPYPTFIPLAKLGITKSSRLGIIPWVLRISAILLLIIILARPQSSSKVEEVHTEGIDIMLALDISSSMLAEDFQPQNRIGAAKEVAKEFISGRVSDRIGLIVFSGESYTSCPLTMDYSILDKFIDDIQVGVIEDGTAIGNALANGLNRLRESKAKSKIIILLTDGENNRGEIDPLTAAQAATPFGIKIYTIGVGKEGTAPYPFKTPFGIRYQQIPVKIDEELLKKVADITGGKYFRAKDEAKLKQIYSIIDKMEKSKIEVKEYRKYSELYLPYALAVLGLFLLEIALSGTRLRRIP